VRDHSKLVSYSGMIGGGLALLAVVLRTFARMPRCGGTWGWDDWGILVTMVIRLCSVLWSLLTSTDTRPSTYRPFGRP
jgi:hypothetical protein